MPIDSPLGFNSGKKIADLTDNDDVVPSDICSQYLRSYQKQMLPLFMKETHRHWANGGQKSIAGKRRLVFSLHEQHRSAKGWLGEWMCCLASLVFTHIRWKMAARWPYWAEWCHQTGGTKIHPRFWRSLNCAKNLLLVEGSRRHGRRLKSILLLEVCAHLEYNRTPPAVLWNYPTFKRWTIIPIDKWFLLYVDKLRTIEKDTCCFW